MNKPDAVIFQVMETLNEVKRAKQSGNYSIWLKSSGAKIDLEKRASELADA